MGTNTNDDQVPTEIHLRWLREERDCLVAANSWLDEPDLRWDVLGTLRDLEGAQRRGATP